MRSMVEGAAHSFKSDAITILTGEARQNLRCNLTQAVGWLSFFEGFLAAGHHGTNSASMPARR